MNGPTGADDSPQWPQRVQNMIDMGALRHQPSSHPAIAALWQKALDSAHDAELSEISIDGSLQAAYTAGLQAVVALLSAHKLRLGRREGHHEMAFAGAAALGYDDLEDLVAESSEIRGLRKASMYDPVIAGAEERDRALEWIRRTLPAIRAALLTADPGLAPEIREYP